ncbi:MAG: ComEC/Rec2 family competence protein [Candidatus Marinimicrobia bacterium]|nr:ComEC/Rec2 family competence protein [Candidatus Neomarinimicrobiota bacterium]
MTRKTVLVVLGLTVGVVFCRVWSLLSLGWVLAGVTILVVVSAGWGRFGWRGWLAHVLIFTLAVALGWWRADRHCAALESGALALRLVGEGKFRADLRGVVEAEPVALSDLALHVPLRATEMRLPRGDWAPIAPEGVRLVLIARRNERQCSFAERLPDLLRSDILGDQIEVRGATIQPQRGFADRAPARPWSAVAVLAHWTGARHRAAGPGNRWLETAVKARRVLAAAFERALNPLANGLARGMVLGLRADAYRADFRGLPMRDVFAQAGIGHLLAVSGLHVSLIAAGLCAALTRLRCPRRITAPLAVAGIGFYVLMVGMPACTVRAGIMNALGVLAWAFSPVRDRRILVLGLCGAAAFILAADPGQLFEVGFQISFLSVLSLVSIAPLADASLTRLGWRRGRAVRMLVAAQLALLLGVLLPISPYYFGHFSCAGLLVNLVAIPLAGILLPFSLGLAVLGLLPGPGVWLAGLLGHPLGLLYRLLAEVAWAGAVTLPYPALPRPPLWAMALYYAALIAFVIRWQRRQAARGAAESLNNEPTNQEAQPC